MANRECPQCRQELQHESDGVWSCPTHGPVTFTPHLPLWIAAVLLVLCVTGGLIAMQL